jgi:hypothetical protein
LTIHQNKCGSTRLHGRLVGAAMPFLQGKTRCKPIEIISGLGVQVASVAVGNWPDSSVWDQATHSVYVDMYKSAKIFVLTGTHVTKKISGPSAVEFDGITYDDATDQVYATGWATNTVYSYA